MFGDMTVIKFYPTAINENCHTLITLIRNLLLQYFVYDSSEGSDERLI